MRNSMKITDVNQLLCISEKILDKIDIDNKSCIICIEPLVSVNDICMTICGHIYHKDCLLSWVNTSRTCPTCKEQL